MQTRKRPAGNRPSPHRTNRYADFSLHRPEDGYAAPSVCERREQQLLDELRALGYTVAVFCTACGHPLTAGRSVARHLGPKCAAKAVTG